VRGDYRPGGDVSIERRRGLAVLTVLSIAALAARLSTLPAVPDVDDSILFVNGVIRFSIREMRPHWPCYPVYIWAGKAITAIVGDPVLGLHLLSAVSSVLLAWPLAFVAREWARSLDLREGAARFAGWAAAALWLVTPMGWVTASQIVSDTLGLLLGMLVLALAVAGERSAPGEPSERAAWTAAAVVAGLMIGVRLVNVVMLCPFLWKAWSGRRRRWWRVPPVVALAAGAVVGMAPWVAWLWSEGLTQYVQAARYHLTGHFSRWGESVVTDVHPVQRPIMALRMLVLFGLGAGPPALGWARVGSAVGWTWILVLAIGRRLRSRVALVVALCFVPDSVYLFFAHDISLPRYSMPLVALVTIVAGLAVARRPRPGWAAGLLAVVSMALVSHHLARSRRAHPLVEYSAVQFLTRQTRPAIGIIDVPTFVFYLSEAGRPDIPFALTSTEQLGKWLDRWRADGRRIFLTAPPLDPTGWQPAAHFCLDPLVDPRPPQELWLFSQGPAPDGGAALRGCEGL
jgi:transmembrane protein TMEM260 (protein O-mannosyltransferase)